MLHLAVADVWHLPRSVRALSSSSPLKGGARLGAFRHSSTEILLASLSAELTAWPAAGQQSS